LPNSMHREWTERAATAAKHVLCEKPLAATSADARAMAEAVRAARVLLMEAYMTPFHPRSAEAVRLAAAGNAGPLGDLQAIDATFRFPLEDPLNHRWRPEMGGGALLDVGIYCLAPMFSATRTSPSAATVTLASVNIGGGGVDATLSATLRLGEQGPVARFDVSFEKEEHQSITFEGSAGVMHVDTSFTPGREDEHLVVELRDGSKEEIWTGGEDPYRGMVDHFADCVRGRTQMSRTPADSIELLELMERIRAVAMAGR
ncbi:MAG TPA: Gfo/Idh/MocA family oxidoreductase, partial [Acidimicrobiales bacterium]|nr:Gfo/Idh/MocA family oxidoreductase [Acidimicrobiales bacterium]